MDISPSSPDLIQPYEPPSPDGYWIDNYSYNQNFSPLTLMDNNSSDGNTMPSEPESRTFMDSPQSPSPSYHADSDEAILDSDQGSSPQSGRAFSPSDLLDWRHPLLPPTDLPHSSAYGPMTAQDSLSAFVDGLSDTNPRSPPYIGPPTPPYSNHYSPSDSSPIVSDLGRMDDTHSSPSSDRPFSPMDLLVDNPSADNRAQFDHSYVRDNVRELTEQLESAARDSARLETSLGRVQRLAERVNTISSRLYGSSASTASPELVSMRFYSPSPPVTEPTGRASPLESEPLSPPPVARPVRQSVIRPGFDWSRTSSPDLPSPLRRDSPMPDADIPSPRGLSPPGTWFQDGHSPVRYSSPPLSPRNLSPAPAARIQPRYQLRSYTHTAARPRAPSPEVQEPAFLRLRRISERLRSPVVNTERDRPQNPQARSGVIVSSRTSNPTNFLSRLRRARLQTIGPDGNVTSSHVYTAPVHSTAVLPLPMEPVSLNNSTKKKISFKVKETMAKVGIDDGTTARTSRALTPDSCSVCLEVPKPLDASLTYPCLHTFCNECISVWVQTKSSCPNCQAKVTRILYNLRGESDYDVKSVEDRNNLITAPPFDGDFFEFFFHLHQRVANRNQENRGPTSTAIRPVREPYQVSEVFARNFTDLPNALQQERILPSGFEVSRVSFRRAVYAQRLMGCSDRHTGFEAARDMEVPQEITAEISQRPGCLRLLFPWLRREVMAAVVPEASNATREHFYAVLSQRVNRPVTYDQYVGACQDWLRDGRERIFWREMLQFLSSRIEMGVWDQERRYFTLDGAVYDPASLNHAGHDEDVQVVDVVLRDPHRPQRNGRNVEVILVDSDDDVSRSTNGRTNDSTQATNGTVDSDREMNWLPSETDTDATDYRENWARRHEEVETSDDAMETEEAPSRSHGESSRRRDTPEARSTSAADEIDRLISQVIQSANSFHRRGNHGARDTLHRQEVSQPVRRRPSASRSSRSTAARDPRYTRIQTASRSRRARHGNRHAPYTARGREDPADTDSEDAQPIPLRPRRLRTLRETAARVTGATAAGMERTARGDSPDPRRYRSGHASNASERYNSTMGRLRSRRPRS